MEDFAEDVMRDILSRLNYKTVSCCKCVCKRWRDLVLDPYFINNLLWSNKKNMSLMIHDATIILRGRLKWIEIQDKVVEVEKEQLVDVVTIYDVDLSRPGVLSRFPNLIDFQVFIGPSVNAYEDTNKIIQIDVFTLGTDNWRVLQPNDHFSNIHGYMGDGLFFNGRVHWINAGGRHQLFAFELDNENFKLFPSPSFEGEENEHKYPGILGVLKGCLSQGCYYSCEIFTVWVMKEHGIKDSWYKAFTIKETRIARKLRCPLCLLDGLKGVEDDGGVEEDQVVQPQGNASDREYMTNLRDQIAQQLMQSGSTVNALLFLTDAKKTGDINGYVGCMLLYVTIAVVMIYLSKECKP
nr:hypothetical protein [Tanacetum cinerariifolium]